MLHIVCLTKQKKTCLAAILLSCAVLFSSCSGESYKNSIAKTLWKNQEVFDRIAQYMVEQHEMAEYKLAHYKIAQTWKLGIYSDDFLNGNKLIVDAHNTFHDWCNESEDLCCMPIEDEQVLADLQYLFENLKYASVSVSSWGSYWKNDVEVDFIIIPRVEKWESYSYHTADFPPEGKDGHSIKAYYHSSGENEYVGGNLYLGDSWYYSCGDREGYGKYAS